MGGWKLVVFRIFNLTLGRIRFFSWTVKRVIVNRKIKSQPFGGRYVASSRYFDARDIDESKESG